MVKTATSALSQAALARALGLSPARIVALKYAGMPVHSVKAAECWRAKHMDPAHLKENKAPAMMAGPKPPRADEVDDWGEGDVEYSDEAGLFISAALFARVHGIRRYGPMLVHLWLLLSDESRGEVERSDEMPQAVWDAWDDLVAKFQAAFGKFDEAFDEAFGDGPAPR